MLRSILKLLILHVKIGFRWRLILVDIVALGVAVIEIIRFKSYGLDLASALRLVPQILSLSFLLNLALFVFIGLFVVPAFIGFILLLGGRALRLNRNKTQIKIIHLSGLLIIVVYLILGSAMQVSSGYMVYEGIHTYAFSSSLLDLSRFSTITVAFFGLVLFVAPPAFSWFLEKKKPALLEDYAARLYLADLGGDFYPKFIGKKANFNSGAMAPEIRFVKRYAARLAQRYQELLPGSRAAGTYLQQLILDCELLLSALILELPSQDLPRIDFFSSTSRALEVALLQVVGAKKILLSPYEHPVESKIGEWLSYVEGSMIRRIEFSAEDFQLHWNFQEDKIVDEFKRHASTAALPIVVVISEVCYATGLHIPIDLLLKRFFREVEREDVVVIVDGAHAAGNGRMDLKVDFDYYVFSTHKWLFSPDPCGVLLTARRRLGLNSPYDGSSRNALSETTVNFRSIAGLRASLELINKVGWEKIWDRSCQLRDHLISKLGEKFEVVGSETGLPASHMLSIRPRIGLRWDYEDFRGLAGYFANKDINVQVIAIDPKMPWIRITFPYFIEFQQVNNLLDAIHGALKS